MYHPVRAKQRSADLERRSALAVTAKMRSVRDGDNGSDRVARGLVHL